MNARWQGMTAVMALALVAGCRTSVHQVRVERVDQDMTQGNRGYLVGAPPAVGERMPTRDITEVEIELAGGHKARRAAPAAAAPAAGAAASAEMAPEEAMESSTEAAPSTGAPAAAGPMQTYTVKRGDSLWKIAKKCYGDAYQWRRIYDANRDKLPSPNRVRPGMTLQIPAGGAKTSRRPSGGASAETSMK